MRKRWFSLALLCILSLMFFGCGNVEDKIKDKIDDIVTDETNSITNSLNNDTTPPAAPVLSSVTAIATGVTISWNASVDTVTVSGISMDVPVMAYRIYRNNTIVGGTGSATTYTDTNVSAATDYCYAVTAVDQANNESPRSQEMCATTLATLIPAETIAPSMPANLRLVTDPANRALIIGWDASTDNSGGSGVAGYKVYRNYALLSTSQTTTYVDSAVTASTSYCYSVSAVDYADNESVQSMQKCTMSVDFIAPSIVTGVTASAFSSSSINISWSPASDNNVLLGYNVYRDSVLLQKTPITFLSDTGLAVGTQYCYQVSAYDASGNEGPKSSPACAKPSDNVIPPPSGPTIVSRTPAPDATNVPINTTIKIVFSEAMDVTSINSMNFTLAVTAIPVTCSVTYDPATFTATMSPTASLSGNNNYLVQISGSVRDNTGNLFAGTNWSFTTAPPL